MLQLRETQAPTMPTTASISCAVWGRKGYGKTSIRENLEKLFGEKGTDKPVHSGHSSSTHGGLQKPVKPKLKNKVMVTSRAWFGLTADTITSLANSYPITVEMKEMKNSWYSLESEYYLKQLKTATVILYVIDSTARWELHEERPLFEKFLNIIYGNQTGPPLAVIFTKCDEAHAEADFMEECLGLTERSWKCWGNIPDYRVLKVQCEDRISDDIHIPTTPVCKKAYDMRNIMATILILAQNNAPLGYIGHNEATH